MAEDVAEDMEEAMDQVGILELMSLRGDPSWLRKALPFVKL